MQARFCGSLSQQEKGKRTLLEEGLPSMSTTTYTTAVAAEIDERRLWEQAKEEERKRERIAVPDTGVAFGIVFMHSSPSHKHS